MHFAPEVQDRVNMANSALPAHDLPPPGLFYADPGLPRAAELTALATNAPTWTQTPALRSRLIDDVVGNAWVLQVTQRALREDLLPWLAGERDPVRERVEAS